MHPKTKRSLSKVLLGLAVLVAAVFVVLGLAAAAGRLAATVLEVQRTHPWFRPARVIGATVLLAWLGGLVAYLVWAIRRYSLNYGLSDEEWMLLHPALYAPAAEHDDYARRRSDAMDSHRQLATSGASGDAAPAVAPPAVPAALTEPAANPYERDSLGLPPGTLRGLLALTALVMFLVVEMVNLFDTSLERSFSELVVAFQMVLAFYFGSRAVEVLQTRERELANAVTSAPPAAPPTTEAATAGAPRTVNATPVHAPTQVAPSETALLPARLSDDRRASMAIAGASPSTMSLVAQPLAMRVLALTASFETGLGFPACFGEVAGNFDGQGISFGALQWNIGTGSLQPLLEHMRREHAGVVGAALPPPLRASLYRMLDATSRAEQLAWARSIQLTRAGAGGRAVWVVNDAWKSALRCLGTSKEMIDLQVAEAANRYQIALADSQHFGLWSERAVALFFDLNVQNGKVAVAGAAERIRADVGQLDPGLGPEGREVAKMRIIARRRAEVSRPEWVTDVLARKHTIATGTGLVHGRAYDLGADFGILLRPVPELMTPPTQPPALGRVA